MSKQVALVKQRSQVRRWTMRGSGDRFKSFLRATGVVAKRQMSDGPAALSGLALGAVRTGCLRGAWQLAGHRARARSWTIARHSAPPREVGAARLVPPLVSGAAATHETDEERARVILGETGSAQQRDRRAVEAKISALEERPARLETQQTGEPRAAAAMGRSSLGSSCRSTTSASVLEDGPLVGWTQRPWPSTLVTWASRSEKEHVMKIESGSCQCPATCMNAWRKQMSGFAPNYHVRLRANGDTREAAVALEQWLVAH